MIADENNQRGTKGRHFTYSRLNYPQTGAYCASIGLRHT
jgi:hypothetical protein